MKFHKITKPLTALALCALLATAYNVYAASGDKSPGSYAGISPAAGEESVTKDNAEDIAVDAAQEATAAPAADANPADANADAVPASDMATDATADNAAADDDLMPPMAIANSAPVPSDLKPSPDESRIAPTMKQLQTVDMNEAGPSSAYAPRQRIDEEPYVEPVGETHPTLNMTPDKSTIVRLDRPAASVVVGNEAHISVLIDTPTTLIVVPRMPGASYFTVLDAERRIVMRRHVVVGPAGQYVRVRRSCGATAANCEHTSVFYCPDGMCHPINTQQNPAPPPSQSSAGIAIPAGMMGGNGTNNSYESTDDINNSTVPSFENWPFIPVPIPVPGYGGNQSEQAE